MTVGLWIGIFVAVFVGGGLALYAASFERKGPSDEPPEERTSIPESEQPD